MKSPKIFLIVALISGLIGFSNVGSGTITGVGQALFGSFMCLFFIALFFGREEA